MPRSSADKLTEKLSRVYSPSEAAWLADELVKVIKASKVRTRPAAELKQSDIALVTYANSIEDKRTKAAPLAVLRDWLSRYRLSDALPIVHLLPFYPWDTDRGFSVQDYRQVDPANGSWEDIDQLGQQVKLMFDFVANHASIDNPLVQGALIERHLDQNDPRYQAVAQYKDFVTAYTDEDKPSDDQLAALSRPRHNPVLTRYTVYEDNTGEAKAKLGLPADLSSEALAKGEAQQKLGEGWVWTTFSREKNDDGTETTRQVDINFANPRVFLEVINILLFYIGHEADFIRLDAIGYIWKVMGSASLHEPQAHTLLEVTDAVMKEAAPSVSTIAEVNEPQDKVLPYLGTKDHPEADLVYQFTHFPLAVHAVQTGDAKYYRDWLKTTNVFAGRQFTTVLGSHDGMGLKPVRGILPDDELEKLTDTLINRHNALPNFAQLPGGKKIVYEVCATPWHIINNPNANEPLDLQIDRYRVVLALGLIVQGIPAIYINGVLGAANYLPPEGLDENRTVNREIFDKNDLFAQLDDDKNQQRQVLDAVAGLLKARAAEPAFSPNAHPIDVLDCQNDAVVCVRLTTKDQTEQLTVLINVSDQAQHISLPYKGAALHDVLSGEKYPVNSSLDLELTPYQVLWLKAS